MVAGIEQSPEIGAVSDGGLFGDLVPDLRYPCAIEQECHRPIQRAVGAFPDQRKGKGGS